MGERISKKTTLNTYGFSRLAKKGTVKKVW